MGLTDWYSVYVEVGWGRGLHKKITCTGDGGSGSRKTM